MRARRLGQWALVTLAFVILISVSNKFSGATADTVECSHALKGQIIDDDSLNAAMLRAQTRFLASRPKPITRFAATLLVLDRKTFRRGSFQQTEIAYPASTVKLAYLVSGIQWCKDNGLPFDCLRHAQGPMIGISSNFDTGLVVDFTSGAPNIWDLTTNNTDFYSWAAKRNYTQRFLDSRGLLENMVVLHKTYPTNSGSDPVGAEKVAREVFGMNQMCPKCAASIMAEIVAGALHPEARSYMLDLLLHDQNGDYSTLGYGLPPGTTMYTKIGVAYDTLEEIAYIILPNGKKIIVAAYSNGYEPYQPTLSGLSAFASFLLEETSLSEGLPRSMTLQASLGSNNPKLIGDWQTQTQRDQYGDSFLASSNASAHAIFSFKAPADGLYAVYCWNPENSANTNSAQYAIQNRDGVAKVTANLKLQGGRWVKLTDLNFLGGVTFTIDVSNGNLSAGQLVVNALRVSAWPSCNNIPGTTCLPNP